MSAACERTVPNRPSGVAAGAIWVPHGFNGLWIHCWVDEAIALNRCRVHNGAGEPIPPISVWDGKGDPSDDVFVRYEGSGPLDKSELLLIDKVRSDLSAVWFTNGEILIPRYAEAFYRQWIDKIKRQD
jgi:hypothetical protein